VQSLDPVAQLVGLADARGARIAMLAMSDQWGVVHAPFGGARALLTEGGHARAAVLVHAGSGELLQIPAVGTSRYSHSLTYPLIHLPLAHSTHYATHSLTNSINQSMKEDLVPNGCASALSEHLQTACS
jgi:hypothetical protein